MFNLLISIGLLQIQHAGLRLSPVTSQKCELGELEQPRTVQNSTGLPDVDLPCLEPILNSAWLDHQMPFLVRIRTRFGVRKVKWRAPRYHAALKPEQNTSLGGKVLAFLVTN